MVSCDLFKMWMDGGIIQMEVAQKELAKCDANKQSNSGVYNGGTTVKWNPGIKVLHLDNHKLACFSFDIF